LLWLRALGRDEASAVGALAAKDLRVCADHLSDLNSFSIHATEKDPIFREWLIARSANAQWAQLESCRVHPEIINMVFSRLTSSGKILSSTASSGLTSVSTSVPPVDERGARAEGRTPKRFDSGSRKIPMSNEAVATLASAHEQLKFTFQNMSIELDAEKSKNQSLAEELATAKLLNERLQLTRSFLSTAADRTVRDHTGLPKLGFILLMQTLEIYGIPLALERFRTITWDRAVIMSLHFAKTDPGYEVLRLRFCLRSPGQVSRVLRATIPLILEIIKHAVGDPLRRPWPYQRIPHLGPDTQFCDVEHITDCTCFSCERAHHHEIDAAQFSTYMLGHKGKLLIDGGADGYVLYGSRVYGSSMSDQDIGFDSEWLDNIAPNEVILFDKGATPPMRVAVEARGATLTTPSYVVNGYLTYSEVAHSIGVARARVVIENINERVESDSSASAFSRTPSLLRYSLGLTISS